MPLLVINLAVAGVTGTGRLLVFLGFVAVRANHIDVLARQREFGGAVVKPNIFPIGFRMAIGAQLAQTALVHVVFLMANAAIQ